MDPTGRLDSITTLMNHHTSRMENGHVGAMTELRGGRAEAKDEK